MSVVVNLLGRLGNNLFQYAIGRIIAEHHGLALECTQVPDEPMFFLGRKQDCGPSATLEALAAYMPNAPLSLPGRRVTTPVERIEMTRGNTWRGQTIHLPSILANPMPRQIRLGGYFQRYEYYAPYRSTIRHWFQVSAVDIPWRIAPDDIVLNIRRGIDYGVQEWTLSLSYYERALARARDRGRVFVCGACIDDQVRHRLEKYQPIYFEGTPIEHFAFMMRFNRLVLSNSTFAWWAAFLSDAVEIQAPRSPDGRAYSFTGFQDVDLHMREPRYHEIEIELARFAPFVPTDAVVTRLRAQGARPDLIGAGLDEASRDLLIWLARRTGPTTLEEVRSHYGRPDVHEMFGPLVNAGLVSAQTRYLDGEGD